MGKIISIALGALAAVIGAILLINWWSDFLIGLRASVPVILIFGGVIALIAGLSELKDELKSKSEKKE